MENEIQDEGPPQLLALQEVYILTARRADTETQKIGADEVSRVLASFFRVLSELTPGQVQSVLSQGLRRAERFNRRKQK